MNRTEQKLVIDIGKDETPNLAVTQMQTPIQVAMSPAPKLGAAASFVLHWPEYLMEAGLLGAFMVSACVFGALYEFPQSPVHQAIMSPALRRLLMGMSMGLDSHRDHLFAVGKTVWRAHQPIGDVHFFPAGQNQGLGCALLYRRAVPGSGPGSAPGRAFSGQGIVGPGSSLRRYAARAAWAVGGAFRGIHYRIRSDVRRPLFLQSSSARPLHRTFRRLAGRYLHHPGSAFLRDEYESRSDLRLGLPSHDLGWTSGST